MSEIELKAEGFRRRWLLAGFLSLTAGLTCTASARADDAKELLKAMSDFMAKQQTLSFDYETTLEAVTLDFEKLQFVSSGSVSMQRPDKIRATRKGGFADLELVFDGNNLTVHGKNLGAYAQVAMKGSLDELGDWLADAGVNAPASDLLASNDFESLTDGVTEAKHISGAVVGGVECEYLALRTSDVDLQIWIADGDKPFPLRYVITSKHVLQAPQYTVELRDWKSGADVAATDFSFAPGTAKKVDLSQIEMTDELPDATSEGVPQ
jgi:hypothetical protein